MPIVLGTTINILSFEELRIWVLSEYHIGIKEKTF